MSLKFKARSNTLHLNSRTSSWAGSQTDSLCNLCNNNASENLEHFMLFCNATDDLRVDEFHKHEQRLIERGLHAAWNLFNTGENDIKLFVLLGGDCTNLLPTLSNDQVHIVHLHFDSSCKSLLKRAWKNRNDSSPHWHVVLFAVYFVNVLELIPLTCTCKFSVYILFHLKHFLYL